MSRTANTNYTASGTAFVKATADTDPFDAGDVQLLAEAVDTHTHGSTRGLPVVRFGVKGADIASAAALTLGTDGSYFHVTGTTTITSISTRAAGEIVVLEFDGALTITHHATALIMRNAANAVTIAGDIFTFVSEGSGNWREILNARAFDATVPTTSALADAAAAGTAATPARRDHTHGRESFGAVSALANAGANGSAATPSRSDHQHKRDVRIRVDGAADTGTRNRINFISGTGITVSAADDAGDDEVEVTVTSTSSGVALLNADVTVAQVVNTVTETTMYTYTVPGNTLGTTKMLRISALMDAENDTGSDRTITVRVKYGGTVFAGVAHTISSTATGRQAGMINALLVAANSASAQYGGGSVGFNGGSAAQNTSASPPDLTKVGDEGLTLNPGLAIDSTSDQALIITIELSAASASLDAKVYAVTVEKLG